MAMLVPPPSMKGWKIHTVGDDISWLRVGAMTAGSGRSIRKRDSLVLRRAPARTPIRNAVQTVKKNTIFTNVALRDDGTVWWEGHDDPVPDNAIDWRGKPWDPEGGQSRRPS